MASVPRILLQPLDLSADGSKFFLDFFVTAVEMINAVNDRETLRHKGGKNQGRACAQVGGDDVRAGKMGLAL